MIEAIRFLPVNRKKEIKIPIIAPKSSMHFQDCTHAPKSQAKPKAASTKKHERKSGETENEDMGRKSVQLNGFSDPNAKHPANQNVYCCGADTFS